MFQILRATTTLGAILLLTACGSVTPMPTATPLPSATATLSPTITLTPTTVPSPTVTASPTASLTPTGTPTLVPSSTPVVPTATPVLVISKATQPASYFPLPSDVPISVWKDVPIMPNAIGGQEGKSGYTYSVKATIAQVQDFYNRAMPPMSWELWATGGREGVNIIWFYRKGTTSIGILAIPQEDLMLVMISYP
jgi:hypothetical protein